MHGGNKSPSDDAVARMVDCSVTILALSHCKWRTRACKQIVSGFAFDGDFFFLIHYTNSVIASSLRPGCRRLWLSPMAAINTVSYREATLQKQQVGNSRAEESC
jgi:hypothetical protein